MWKLLAEWPWKIGFDFTSLLLWGEPKFPMPDEE